MDERDVRTSLIGSCSLFCDKGAASHGKDWGAEVAANPCFAWLLRAYRWYTSSVIKDYHNVVQLVHMPCHSYSR